MIALIRRILGVTGKYQRKVQLAFVFSFIKSFLSKLPIVLSFLVLTAFYQERATTDICVQIGIAMVVCVLLQTIFQHLSDRLQSALKKFFPGANFQSLETVWYPKKYITRKWSSKMSALLMEKRPF